MKLATAITKQRLAREIPVGDLAEATGISEERLEAIEEGDNITISEVLRIADALDITIDIEAGFQPTAAPAAHVVFQG